MQRDHLERIARDARVWAQVIEMRDAATEIGALCRPAKLLPPPGEPSRQREALLLEMLQAERRRNARLLELLAR